MTVPEVRRLLTRLIWTDNQLPDFILYWSCGDGATKPEPRNATTNDDFLICDCSTSEPPVCDCPEPYGLLRRGVRRRLQL